MPPDSQVILVAEDQAATRELTAFLLENEGYEVLTAGNGDLAYALVANAQRLDLLISDINMPGGMDGIELAERLCDARDALAVILTSGHARTSFGTFPERTHFLPKPYDRRHLLDAVQEALAD